MTPKTTTTTSLIVATFALVGLLTTGAVVVPTAFAQTADGIRDGPETTRETTEQTEDQSERNTQASSIDQDQTAAINEEIGSGEGSELGSAANSEAESTYKTKYKSKHGGSGTSIPGESIAASDSTSNVSNNGTVAQDQILSSPVQVNDNQGGNDQSRSAVVDFDLEFEQFTESSTESATPDVGTTEAPILIP